MLWFMATFLGLWAASLIVRGLVGERVRRRRVCPACGDAVASGLTCGGCGYEAKGERDLTRARPKFVMVAVGAVILPIAVGAGYVGQQVHIATTQTGEMRLGFGGWDAAAAGALAFGVVLLAWAVRGDRSRGRRRCPRCWYDMAGVGLRCPECGHEARHVSKLYKARRYHWPAVAGVLVVLSAAAVHSIPLYLAGGWVAVVPATVSIAVFPWGPEELVTTGPPGNNEFTLSGRLWGNGLSRWQERWLRAKGARVLLRSGDAVAVNRALELGIGGSVSLHNAVRVAAQALGSTSAERQDAGLRCVWTLMSSPLDVADADRLLSNEIPGLLRTMGDPTRPPQVSWACAALLARCPKARAQHASELVAAMEAAPTACGMSYVAVLGVAAADTPELRDALAAVAHTGTGARSLSAMDALASYGQVGSDEIERALLQTVAMGTDTDSITAAQILSRNRRWPGTELAALLRQAESQRDNRADYLVYIADYGVEAVPVAPQILALSHDDDPFVRANVFVAIRAIAPALADAPDQPLDQALEAGQHDADLKVQGAALLAKAAIDEARAKRSAGGSSSDTGK